CINNGEGVTINGTSLTTDALAATGSVTLTINPGDGNTVTIAGPVTPTSQVYRFSTSITTTPTANRVLIAGTNALSASNLRAAINADPSQCGSPANGPCFGPGTLANANVSAPSVSTNEVSL